MAGSCSWNVPTQFDISFLSSATRLIYVKVFGTIAFLLATTVIVMADVIPLPRARPLMFPRIRQPSAQKRSCRRVSHDLLKLPLFKPLPPITGLGDCTATDVVELGAVLLPNNHRVNFSPTAILRCPMAGAVAHWVRNDVAPTITTLGKSLRGVVTLDSYDCRLRNGVANAKIGEHGHANALDVRAFKFANGAAIELTDANVAKSLREKLQQCLCSFFDRTG